MLRSLLQAKMFFRLLKKIMSEENTIIKRLPLRFLIDESSGRKLFLFLISIGYDAKFVSDIMPSEEDNNILAFAEKENRIIITNDKDFGELIFRFNKTSSGVILLRLNNNKPENRITYLLEVLYKYSNKLMSSFTVVTEAGVRIRKISF